jgi:C4-dicarboxylate-binding protein DctP
MKYGANVGGIYTLGYAVLASDKFMAKLTPEQKKILMSTLAEVTADEIKGVKELDEKDRAALEAKGHKITTLPSAEIAKWREATESVYKQFENEVGPEVIKLLQAQRQK